LMGTMAIGCPFPQKRIMAAPPSTVKIGAPRTEARRSPTMPGRTRLLADTTVPMLSIAVIIRNATHLIVQDEQT